MTTRSPLLGSCRLRYIVSSAKSYPVNLSKYHAQGYPRWQDKSAASPYKTPVDDRASVVTLPMLPMQCYVVS
jgi:hypothetical protein